MVEGLLAAGLGLGTLAAIVLLLWTISPDQGSGVRDAMQLAADLWLLAHGAQLLRAETLSGVPAPVGLTPLLLTALPAWLLYRAMRGALDASAGVWRTVPAVAGGYLLAGMAAVVFTAGAPLSAQPLSAALYLPLFALAVTAATAWSLGYHAFAPHPFAPHAFALSRPVADAARVTAIGTLALGAAGALLAAGAVVRRGGVARHGFEQLGGGWSGQAALLALCVALLPNAAVWAAAYGLGPGFTLGAGNVVGPLAPAGDDVTLPAFPLLAAAPGGPPGAVFGWVCAAAVPTAGVLATAWCAARAAVPARGERETATGWGGTLLTVLLGAAGTGITLTLLATLSGGPLGTGSLAQFGPDPWFTGLAATAWLTALATPLALVLRATRLRAPRLISWHALPPLPSPAPATRATPPVASVASGEPGESESGPAAETSPPRAPAQARRVLGRLRRRRHERVDDWSATVCREARWAELKRSSGDLVPEFPNRAPDPPARPPIHPAADRQS